MARATRAAVPLKKGVDASGRAVDGFEDTDDANLWFKQGVYLVDPYGKLIATSTAAGLDPQKVTLTSGGGIATIAANADRIGLTLYLVDGAGFLWGFGNWSANLTNFRANAIPWLPTLPWREAGFGVGCYKGPVYLAIPSGQADTVVFYQELACV